MHLDATAIIAQRLYMFLGAIVTAEGQRESCLADPSGIYENEAVCVGTTHAVAGVEAVGKETKGDGWVV
jgi:hypothetical protein